MRDVIRRVTAFAGLIALIPVGLMLLEGRIGFEAGFSSQIVIAIRVS